MWLPMANLHVPLLTGSLAGDARWISLRSSQHETGTGLSAVPNSHFLGQTPFLISKHARTAIWL